MRTFFALRHMGSVECVTVQVLWRNSRDGEPAEGRDGEVVVLDEGLAYLVGERRMIGDGDDILRCVR